MNTQFFVHLETQHKQFIQMQNVPLSMQELMLHCFAIDVLLALLRRRK